jgi:hypothetical protein
MEALLARRKRFEGTEARTQIIWRRFWPEENNWRDQSPHSNNIEVLLAQRKQFEGPKPVLK